VLYGIKERVQEKEKKMKFLKIKERKFWINL